MSREILRGYLLNNAVIQRHVDVHNERFNASRQELSRRVLSDSLISPYIPQIDTEIRKAAAEMAAYYEVFYMLENHIRGIIVNLMDDLKGQNWWEDSVSEPVRISARRNIQRELDAGVSLRSREMIDYITFGELGEIIKSNWDIFGQIFSSPKGVEKVMNSLNILRGTIAHCGMLSDDEILRLKLALRDWFRLME